MKLLVRYRCTLEDYEDAAMAYILHTDAGLALVKARKRSLLRSFLIVTPLLVVLSALIQGISWSLVVMIAFMTLVYGMLALRLTRKKMAINAATIVRQTYREAKDLDLEEQSVEMLGDRLVNAARNGRSEVNISSIKQVALTDRLLILIYEVHGPGFIPRRALEESGQLQEWIDLLRQRIQRPAADSSGSSPSSES